MDLALLILAVALAAVAGHITHSIRRALTALRAIRTSDRSPDLGHYELAYLAGGPRRVAETAIVLLTEVGALRASRGGNVYPVAGGPRSDDPIDEVVLSAVLPSGASVLSLREQIARSRAMERLGQRLTERGLIRPDDLFCDVDRLSVRLRMTTALAFTGAVLSGLLLLFAGTTPMRVAAPALFLATIALMVYAGTLLSVRARAASHRPAATLTPKSAPRRTLAAPVPAQAGRRALEDARRELPRGGAELHLSVALHGPGRLSRTSDLYGAFDPAKPVPSSPARPRGRRSGASSGGSGGGGGGSCASYVSSCSSGSSGGGGSCGGGGGCGGGGC
ncbi:TIGR04222 domain-containing membrane protein [Nonomuraea terrae]|uniref:TIGR04222 domain-containing membrane protein n=1 Tax=Nonomuraea terrae TaxID=2530383 RepID=A0A4R4Z4B4_9ACTN|nr:TIGR04222 domain-containing membrane protein [Nonomuraea terrae]TDD52888.1 TIGR04222 domain-containing membrane protein [Nonomuraea terrae]